MQDDVAQQCFETGCGHRGFSRYRVRCELRHFDVFAAGTFGTLADVERHGLSFAQIIEMGLGTSRVVEEIFGAVTREDEAETFVRDETFDGAAERSHMPDSFESIERNV